MAPLWHQWCLLYVPFSSTDNQLLLFAVLEPIRIHSVRVRCFTPVLFVGNTLVLVMGWSGSGVMTPSLLFYPTQRYAWCTTGRLMTFMRTAFQCTCCLFVTVAHCSYPSSYCCSLRSCHALVVPMDVLELECFLVCNTVKRYSDIICVLYWLYLHKEPLSSAGETGACGLKGGPQRLVV
uniref:Uncharacterized protein n=1 Tax=Trypanosoma vivax (strain Y486) TaxID=1055687 RepID=G0U6T2_TRYVY|nr:hypothetical protein, conserved in T. vivax [Trypanosoma vivax Y486]